MTIHFDNKGKFFTDIISKVPIQSTIQTIDHKIEGYIYVKPGERVIDELTNSGQFIAVTNATVFNPGGDILYTTDFITINLDQIIWIIPHEDEVNESSSAGGGS